MSDFDSIITSILNPDPKIRIQGEHNLQIAFSHNPEQACYGLLTSMSSNNEDLSGLAAILFRKQLIDLKILYKFSPSNIQSLKSSVLNLVSPHKSILFLKRLGDVLINFSILNSWENELLAYIGNWAVVNEANIKQFAMYMFEIATEFRTTFEIMKENAVSVMGIT